MNLCESCAEKDWCDGARLNGSSIVTKCNTYRKSSDEPAIKDSGDRTTFETGSVRDMQGGKGRFDLMPLESVANLLRETDKGDIAPIIDHINNFIRTKESSYILGALHVFADLNYSMWQNHTCGMLLDVAKHYEEGAKKYGPDNWRKGIPESSYIDSGIRHLLKHISGWTDEPHDRAFVWNMLCLYWEHEIHNKRKEEN